VFILNNLVDGIVKWISGFMRVTRYSGAGPGLA
jgi:hypothetical protein